MLVSGTAPRAESPCVGPSDANGARYVKEKLKQGEPETHRWSLEKCKTRGPKETSVRLPVCCYQPLRRPCSRTVLAIPPSAGRQCCTFLNQYQHHHLFQYIERMRWLIAYFTLHYIYVRAIIFLVDCCCVFNNIGLHLQHLTF